MTEYFILPDPGCVRIGGEDRRAFFQRQTTNQVELLRPERSLLTVLTSPTARILDVLILLDEGDRILALTLPGRGGATGRYLRSRVFFMDKVTVSDESAAYVQVDVFGGDDPLAGLGLPLLEQPNSAACSADGLWAVRLEVGFGLGWRLVAPLRLLPEIEARLTSAGAAPLAEAEYTLRRVEAGLASGREWNEDFTPLETGLSVSVSDSKGCYTGQEIIARQVTYDKVTRRLCGVRLDALVSAPAELSAPDGAPAGRLTIAVSSPRFGAIGLAVVKRPHDVPGSRLQVGDADFGCHAEGSALPFA